MGIPHAPETNQQTAVVSRTVTADTTFPVVVAKGTIDIESCEIVCVAAIATHAANTVAISLVNLGTGGAGTTVVATGAIATAGNAVTALAPKNVPVTAANQQLTDGQALGFIWDEANTDVANADLTVSVRYTQVTAPGQT